MPRRRRIFIPHQAHHIIQRGNHRQNIFLEHEDFANYTFWINKYAQAYKVDFLAYCLMNNHVHFIAVPQGEEGISRLFNTAHMRYAQYLNHKRKTSGHVWQGRFYSCVMDDVHLYRAVRYVEQNPVRAKMVPYPWDYPWSSARWHVRLPVERYIKVTDRPAIPKAGWKDYLLLGDATMDEQIRQSTHKGTALAEERFINLWEDRLQCVLRSLKPGRPIKK